MLDIHARSFQLALRFGVENAAGTPFSGVPMVPHDKNAFELELMVKAGFSPMEAIIAAKKMGIEVLGVDSEVGTIDGGKLAEVIILKGDPILLNDIFILQDSTRIVLVIKGVE